MRAELLGPPGRQCNGDGTCLPARLHATGYPCPICGACCWDHKTDRPDEAFCANCGAGHEKERPKQ